MLPTESDFLPLSLGSGFHAALGSFSPCLFFHGHKIVVFSPVTTFLELHVGRKETAFSPSRGAKAQSLAD